MWRQDAAGNHEPANASVPVTLRFDPEPPQLGFEQSPASDPTLVSVQVTDKVSGLASGQIELSRQGSATWQALPTQRHGSRLVARINDAGLPAGTYLLRATARDQAANQNSTDSRLDGRPMSVTPSAPHPDGDPLRRERHSHRSRTGPQKRKAPDGAPSCRDNRA